MHTLTLERNSIKLHLTLACARRRVFFAVCCPCSCAAKTSLCSGLEKTKYQLHDSIKAEGVPRSGLETFCAMQSEDAATGLALISALRAVSREVRLA